MRWSIRNQILVPLIAIQGVAVAASTLTTAHLAARRGERQVIDRLSGVIAALGHANFPYTAGVLARMHGLSGAHFVACDAAGRPSESSLAGPDVGLSAEALRSVPDASDLDSLGRAPTREVAGARYFALRLRAGAGGRSQSLVVLYPEASWRQARREAALPPLLLGVGSLGLLAAVTCWVAQRFSRRLGLLRRQVARIAEGDFRELDLGPARDDEVQDLARSIDQMCVQLREMRQAIGRAERTRVLGQLAAGLAHQLRNALTGARMSVQLHARRCPGASSSLGGDRSLDVALRQLAMTEEQVRGLLSLGRAERRPPSSFDAGKLLDDVALLVGPNCRHARVALDRGRGDGPLEVRGDESAVRAAVLNLVLNAIEAAGPGGRVGLEVGGADGTVSIEVNDNGPGPPPELAGSLCEPFVTGKPEGVGLGLALARQVADEHGGSLTWGRVDGETRFRFCMPRSVEVLGVGGAA
jgi:signal transduction histidine kinase